MNSYLLTLVLKPEMDEKARNELLEGVKKHFDKVEKEDLWGVKTLAYPIKKQAKGYYAHFEMAADPKNVKGLDKILKEEEDVLRYLLIRR